VIASDGTGSKFILIIRLSAMFTVNIALKRIININFDPVPPEAVISVKVSKQNDRLCRERGGGEIEAGREFCYSSKTIASRPIDHRVALQ